MSGVLCGNCHRKHPTANEVRNCYGASGKLSGADLPRPSQEDMSGPRQDTERAALAASKRRHPSTRNRGNGGQSWTDESAGSAGTSSPRSQSARSTRSTASPTQTNPRTGSESSERSGKRFRPIEDGVYFYDDTYVKVIHARAQGSGRQYAKRFSPQLKKWVYARGLIKHLTPEMAVSQEQARQFGLLYGQCCFCGRTLTREQSICAGYGSTCARNRGLWYPTEEEAAKLLGEAG